MSKADDSRHSGGDGIQQQCYEGTGYSKKDKGKLFKIYYDYEAQDGDTVDVRTVLTDDEKGFNVEFLVLRKKGNHIKQRSRLIPISEMKNFSIVDHKKVKQKHPGKYKVELSKANKNVDVDSYFKPLTPVSSSSSDEDAR